jgi:hypothetical protein
VYSWRNSSFRDIFIKQGVSHAIYLENQVRQHKSENFYFESNADHGTQQVVFLGGNVQNVRLRGFTFNRLPAANSFEYFLYNDPLYVQINDDYTTWKFQSSAQDVITEDFRFEGGKSGTVYFDLKQHQGMLHYDNVTYSTIKKYHKTITLTPGNPNTYTLTKGIVKSLRIGMDNSAGLTNIRIINSVTSDYFDLLDTGNNIYRIPPDGSFGDMRESSDKPGICIGTITECLWNSDPGMKQIVTFGNPTGTQKLYIEMEVYVKQDDGVYGLPSGVE